MPYFLFCFRGKQGENVSPESYTRSRKVSSAPFLSGTVESNTHLDMYSLLKSFNHWRPRKWLGNVNITQDILSEGMFALCSLCVYVYIFWWLFWSSTLAVRENMDSTLRTCSQGREASSLRLFFITQCHISSPLSHFLIPVFHLSAHAASLRQIIPYSLGGVAELRARLNCYLRVQLQSLKPAYPDEEEINFCRFEQR